MLTKEQFTLLAVQPCLSNPCAKSKTIVPGFIDDIWATQKVKTVILGGKITDTGFHAFYKNPIPSPDP